DDALAVEPRGHRGGRNAVLACAGLRDDAALAHAAREQPLADAVVDLVRARVAEVLALQPDPSAARTRREPPRRRERRGPPDVLGERAVELGAKARIDAGGAPR